MAEVGEHVEVETVTHGVYEPPAMVELGSVVELTAGGQSHDTADMKRQYW